MAIAEPPTKIEIDHPHVEEAPTEKKPSQIIREWPDEEWCPFTVRRLAVLPGDRLVEQHCDFGILLRVAGYFDPSSPSSQSSPPRLMIERFGIPPDLISELVPVNDRAGKDAGADLLEAHGF